MEKHRINLVFGPNKVMEFDNGTAIIYQEVYKECPCCGKTESLGKKLIMNLSAEQYSKMKERRRKIMEDIIERL